MSRGPASTLTLPSVPRTGLQLGAVPQTRRHREHPRPGASPQAHGYLWVRPAFLEGRHSTSGILLKTWISSGCVLGKPWRGEGVAVTPAVPELLAASAKPPRPFPSASPLAPRVASAQSGSQTDTHTGGTRGDSPALAEDGGSAPQGWSRKGTPRASSWGHWDLRAQPLQAHQLCASQAASAHTTRGQVWILAVPLGVCTARGTHVSARVCDNIHTYVRKYKCPWPPHLLSLPEVTLESSGGYRTLEAGWSHLREGKGKPLRRA